MKFLALALTLSSTSAEMNNTWSIAGWFLSASTIFTTTTGPNIVSGISSIRTCSHISLGWTSLNLDANVHSYTIERRPDLQSNWKWSSIVEIERNSAFPNFLWNDTNVDVTREYTYRLGLLQNGNMPNSTYSYATVPVTSSCLGWNEYGLSALCSLRFRMEHAFPTFLRMVTFLCILHIVMLCWRKYTDITFTPPRKLQLKPLAPVPQSPIPCLSLHKQRSCSSTENDSECEGTRDSEMSTMSYRDSMMSDRGSMVTTTCSSCSKKFGLFRKRTLCTECNSILCRGCRRANKGKCLCIPK